jgi:hypothetical protein
MSGMASRSKGEILPSLLVGGCLLMLLMGLMSVVAAALFMDRQTLSDHAARAATSLRVNQGYGVDPTTNELVRKP